MPTTKTFTGYVRSIFSSTLRLALALTLAFVSTGLLGYAGHWIWTAQEREWAKKAEVVRYWAANLPNLQMKLRAKTKFVESMMYASIEFDGFPVYLKHP